MPKKETSVGDFGALELHGLAREEGYDRVMHLRERALFTI
jgi:hypothetical protein